MSLWSLLETLNNFLFNQRRHLYFFSFLIKNCILNVRLLTHQPRREAVEVFIGEQIICFTSWEKRGRLEVMQAWDRPQVDPAVQRILLLPHSRKVVGLILSPWICLGSVLVLAGWMEIHPTRWAYRTSHPSVSVWCTADRTAAKPIQSQTTISLLW